MSVKTDETNVDKPVVPDETDDVNKPVVPDGTDDADKPDDSAAAAVQALIDALPDAESITAENAKDVEAQLAAIDEEKASLTDEQLDSLNTDKYIAAAQALGAVYDAMSLEGDNVAKVGTTEYATLQEAFANAPDNSTVVLIADITDLTKEGIATIPAGKTVILDMNGKSITVASDFEGRPIVNNGTLTVTGNGTIDSSNSEFGGYGAINNFGSLTIENGTFRGNVMANGSAVYVRLGGEATIKGGEFQGTRALANDGKLTVYDGTFKTTSCNQTTDSKGGKEHWAYCVVSSGELYFYDGYVEGVQGGLGINSGYAEVSGGTFKTVACEHGSKGEVAFYALYIAGEIEKVEAHISGGTYTSASRVAVLCGNDNTGGDGGKNQKATAYITGGTFIGGELYAKGQAVGAGTNTGDPSITGGYFSDEESIKPYIPVGSTVVPDEDGKYTLGTDTIAVATVNGTGYTTIQAAVNAIAASVSKTGTINMIKDSTENVTIPADVDITLNLADGVTLTNTDTLAKKNGTITNNGTLTVTGSGTIDNVTHQCVAIVNRAGATANLNGSKFTRSKEASTSASNSGGNSYYVVDNRGTMVIDGAEVVNKNGHFSSLIRNLGTSSDQKASLTIKSGVLEQENFIAVKNDDYSVLSIEGGTITSKEQAVQNWGEANITGGTLNGAVITWSYEGFPSKTDISGTAEINGDVKAINYDQGESIPTVNISGGTINGTLAKGIYNNGVKPVEADADSSEINVSGGTFSNEVDPAFCADNFHPNKQSDGSYSVHVHTAAANRTGVVAATCTSKGYTGDVVCSICGEKIELGSATAMIPHSFTSDWKSDGTHHWHTCSVCGLKADVTPHTFKEVIDKEATSSEKGSKHEECTACGYKKVAVEIPATGSDSGSSGSSGGSSSSSGSHTASVTSAKTGDTSMPILWLTFGVVAVLGAAAVLFINKKRSAK